MADLKQYGILLMGLLIGGPLAFGGIASYAGLTQGGNSGNQEEFNTSLPEERFSRGSYGLSPREQLFIAAENDVVFVNAFYSNRTQKQELEGLRDLNQGFGDRVYISLVNESETSEIMTQYGIVDFPKVVVIGGNRNYRSAPLENVSPEAVSSEVCDAFRNLGSAAARCTL